MVGDTRRVDEQTDEPFVAYVERWLATERVTIAGLASRAGIDRGHLYRVLKRQNFKTPSADLIDKVAAVVDMPAAAFPEFREAKVLEAIRDDPRLRDRVYAELATEPDDKPGRSRR